MRRSVETLTGLKPDDPISLKIRSTAKTKALFHQTDSKGRPLHENHVEIKPPEGQP
jgi:hypothetical protein